MKVRMIKTDPWLVYRGFVLGNVYDAEPKEEFGLSWYRIKNPNGVTDTDNHNAPSDHGNWLPEYFEVVEGEKSMKVRLLHANINMEFRGFVEGGIYEAERIDGDDGFIYWKVKNPDQSESINALSKVFDSEQGYGRWNLDRFELVENEGENK